jgi:hypothetical protein
LRRRYRRRRHAVDLDGTPCELRRESALAALQHDEIGLGHTKAMCSLDLAPPFFDAYGAKSFGVHG